MLPRRLLPWLFALALLLGQAAAFAHAIGHLHRDDGGSADPVCELCVAQSHLGHAAPPGTPQLALPGVTYATPGSVAILAGRAHELRAQARAPPVSV